MMTKPSAKKRRRASLAVLFASGGETGALMRAYDWASSPLGPVSDWPPSLCTTVGIALNSQFPTVIFWESDLVMLYNDAYIPILADKHPAALGRPARAVWPEIWSIVGPMLHGVLETGRATWSYDLLLPIVHNSAVGEHYFTFSYSPIRDESGMIRGVFCPVTETTARLQSERREQALRREAEAARERIATTLESITDAFYTLDRQWRFTYVNQRAKELWGRPQYDFLGKNVWEEFPEAARLIFGDQLRAAMAEQVTVAFEGFYPPLGVWLALRVYPSADGLTVYFQDVTARKRAEQAVRESEARYRRLFDSIDEGFCVIEKVEGEAGEPVEFRYVEANPAFAAQTGASDVLGKTIRQVFPGEPQEWRDTYDAVLRTGEPRRFERTLVTQRRELELYAFRVEDGTQRRVAVLFKDITARKRAEAEREWLLAKLQRSNEELRQFSYVVSHDLQEPLRTITSYVQLLARRGGDKLDAEAQEFMGFVVEGAQRMRQLITDLLAYARVDGAAREFTAVDCEALLARVLGDLQAALKDSAAEVTHDPLPTVHGDAGQLGLVFQNLIGNALKFRGEAPPRIHVAARQEGVQWVFSVRDNGIGIDPRHAEPIFQIFQRVHTRREYPGTGIGLAICKKIVEQHGGRIWVESALGQGATFWFTLLVATAPSAEVPAGPSRRPVPECSARRAPG